jgi:hypothetical protein
VTVEEAVMALLAAVAGILLFLGLAQAFDSRPSRRRRYRPLNRRREPSPASTLPDAGDPPPSGDRSVITFSERMAEPVAASGPTIEPVTEELPGADAPGDDSVPALLEACATLYVSGRYSELAAVVEPRLTRHDDVAVSASSAVSALWSLLALSRQALDDGPGAQGALASALAVLPRPVLDGCPPRLAAIAPSVARRLVEIAEQAPGGPERIIAARLALFWLRWQPVAASGGQEAETLLEAAHAALSEGYVDALTASVRHGAWSEARGLLVESREMEELPPARRDVLSEALAASLGEQLEQLTAPAIRGARDGGRAVAGLERADTLLSCMNGTISPRQWAVMTRRLWRGYARFGVGQLKAGSLDDAASALFRALAVNEVGQRRQRQVRAALVWTLEAMGERKAGTVAKLLGEGDRPAAVAEVEQLISLIHRARESGVSQEELVTASTKARLLAQRVEPPSSA